LPSSPTEAAPAWYGLRVGGNRERKVKTELLPACRRSYARWSSSATAPGGEAAPARISAGRGSICRASSSSATVLTDELWHAVHKIRGVTGFAGTVFTRKVTGRIETTVYPARIPERQMQVILEQMDAEGIIARVAKLPADLKDQLLRVLDGPFTSFSGMCEWHDSDKGRLKLGVSIFGRTVPIELDESARRSRQGLTLAVSPQDVVSTRPSCPGCWAVRGR
jgi:hypothetical protein